MKNAKTTLNIELIEIEDVYIHSIKQYVLKSKAHKMNNDQKNKGIFFNNIEKSFSKNIFYTVKDSCSGCEYGVLCVYNIDNENQSVHIDGFYTEDYIDEYKEAARQLIEYVFKNMIARKIYISVLSDNDTLIDIYTDLKFNDEATLYKHIYRIGEFRDVNIMSFYKE